MKTHPSGRKEKSAESLQVPGRRFSSEQDSLSTKKKKVIDRAELRKEKVTMEGRTALFSGEEKGG